MTGNKDTHSGKEIDLVELVKRLWKKKWFIIKITAVFILLGLSIALFSPKEYTAGCVMVPQTRSRTGGSLSGLAAMAGISLGSMGESETISPRVYSKLLNNVELLKELMYTPVNFEGFAEPVTLFDYYTKKEYRKFSLIGTIKKYTIGLPSLIIGAVKGKPKEAPAPAAGMTVHGPAINTLTNKEQACIKILKSRFSLAVNDKEGYISISASMPEPLAAAQVVQQLQILLQKYITDFKIQKAQDSYEFIKQRYNEAKADFEAKQEVYAKFQDANRVLSSAHSRIKGEQIQAEYSIANSLFGELARQLVQAEIKAKEDSPVLTIVEPVVVPGEKSKPKRSMILVIFTLLGGCIGCGLVLTFDCIKSHSDDARLLRKWN